MNRKRATLGVLLSVLLVASSVAFAATGSPTASETDATTGDDWETYRGDDGRTAATNDTGPTGTVAETWNSELPGKPATSAVVVDGVAYVAVTTSSSYPAAGKVVAYDATTGQKLWNSTTLGAATGSVAVEDGQVYVATRGTQNSDANRGGLYALDANTGTVQWHNADADWGSPIVEDGVVYLNNAAYHADTGDQKWDSDSYSVVGVVDGTVYAAGTQSDGTHVAELNPDDGTVAWSTAVPGDGDKQFAVTDDRIYYTADSTDGDDGAYAVSTDGGDLVWQRNLTTGTVASAPAVSDGSVYVLTSDSGTDTVYALSTETGVEQWTHESMDAEEFRTAPIVADGTVYLGGTKNVNTSDIQPAQPTAFAIDGDSGERLWNQTTEGTTPEAPHTSVADGTLYLTVYESDSVETDGSLAAVDSVDVSPPDDGTDDDSNGDDSDDDGSDDDESDCSN